MSRHRFKTAKILENKENANAIAVVAKL